MCRSKHVERLGNIGIINSTTRLHLVGYFYTIYITMHGSMNIQFCPILLVLLESGDEGTTVLQNGGNYSPNDSYIPGNLNQLLTRQINFHP